jgi:hypothetical protein
VPPNCVLKAEIETSKFLSISCDVLVLTSTYYEARFHGLVATLIPRTFTPGRIIRHTLDPGRIIRHTLDPGRHSNGPLP